MADAEPQSSPVADESKIPEQTYLDSNESKQEMASALTSLISTFHDEVQQQDELLSALQNEATSNPDFGKKSRSNLWTTNEVCYWLQNIGLQDYIQSFYASSIDGAILLNDVTYDILKNDLNVKPIHVSKILREIDNLKVYNINIKNQFYPSFVYGIICKIYHEYHQYIIYHITQKMDTPEPNKVDNDSNLNDIISQIKKENEDLLSQLQQQKAINAELTSNISNDFKSVGFIDDTSTTNKDKNGTSTNGKSLNEIVVSQECPFSV